jgi:hypothetical protein
MALDTKVHANRAPRFPLHVPLRYRKSGMPYWQYGKAVNISRTGILFYADEIIPEESVLDMRISFPLKLTLSCQGSIVRAQEPMLAVRIQRYRLLHESE